MKFKGLKNLNSNWYDFIMIRNLDTETKIDIKNSLDVPTIKTQQFYTNIKNLSDKEKITKIIEYYLRNNKINSLHDNTLLDYYNGKFIAVEGTRDLYLQLKQDTLNKEIINKIKEKYIIDRFEYLFSNEFKRIDIGFRENETSYYTYIDKDEEILSINLRNKDKTLISYEKEFLDKYIEYLFNSTDSKIQYYPKGYSIYYIKNIHYLKFGEHPGLYFKSDDFIIRINRYLFNEFYFLMKKHNEKIENAKKLQLTFNDL